MSETVYYKGKLKEVSKLPNETLEQQCKRVLNNKNIKNLHKYYGDWTVYMNYEFSDEYYINYKNSTLYSIINKEGVNTDEDFFHAKSNNNNEIEFEVQYYNGGCGFDEALDEAIENIKNNAFDNKVIALKKKLTEQNQVKRLYNNLKILVNSKVFDEEFDTFIYEYPNLDSIEELNNVIEEEISCWEE